MTKEALSINNAYEIERSTLELLFRLYFDKLSYGSVDDKVNEIKIIIANDHSEYWADITRVVNSPMYIREIKKGLVENGLYSQEIFNKNEFSRLADYDFFSITADYKSTREVTKYTLVFKFPNFIDADSIRTAICAIQNALAVGLIKEENINNVISSLIDKIVFGDYHKNSIL